MICSKVLVMRMKRIATYLGYCLDVDGKERQGLRSRPSLALAYILTLDTLGYILGYIHMSLTLACGVWEHCKRLTSVAIMICSSRQ